MSRDAHNSAMSRTYVIKFLRCSIIEFKLLAEEATRQPGSEATWSSGFGVLCESEESAKSRERDDLPSSLLNALHFIKRLGQCKWVNSAGARWRGGLWLTVLWHKQLIVTRPTLMCISFFFLSPSLHCCIAHGLKDLKIFVPEAVIMGNAATLSCQYDLNKVSETSFTEMEMEMETETPLPLPMPCAGNVTTLSTSTACLIIIITRTLSSLSCSFSFPCCLHYFRLFHLRGICCCFLLFFSFVFLFISVFDLFSLQAVLYSVRWYFNQAEFYRYVPREAKPTVVFAVSGINVDVSEIKHCMTLCIPPLPATAPPLQSF